MTHRLRFMIAQLGPKPGGRDLLTRLLSAGDLPGGNWRRVDQRTWRTGASATPWADRARESGSVTAMRSFRNLAQRRGVLLEVIPLASAADARTALGDVGSLQLSNLWTRTAGGSDVDMEPFAGASASWAHEYHYTVNGVHGTTLMLAGAVEEFVVAVAASGQSWDWPSVSSLATLQARRLHEEATG